MSKCTCCQGTGWVLGATGERRPCSRCRAEDFNAWAKSRTVTRATALMLAAAVTFPFKLLTFAAFLYLALGIWLVPPGAILGAF